MNESSSHSIYTIGHSTHSIEEFIALLQAHGVKKLIDIRTIPRSRHCPQFNQEALKRSLKAVKIGYRHMKNLGGLRHPRKDSLNTGWHNASFRGFADYMQTSQFEKALLQLEKMAQKKPTVIMCAEGNHYRCHRNLIADALTLNQWKVLHIQSRKTAKLHELMPFLKVRKGMIIYK
jgi:uncharacterized protein (DUF488 family)